MSGRDRETIPWDSLAVGATRPAVIRGLNVPFWFILPIAGLPIVLTAVTRNPFWLPGIAVLTALGRWLVGYDHNRPRHCHVNLGGLTRSGVREYRADHATC